MTIQTVTDNQRRRRLAAATTTVIHSSLPDQSTDDALLTEFHSIADQFLEAAAKLPAMKDHLEDLRHTIAMASEPPTAAINSDFKLPDDEPPPAPLPDSRFSLPSDEPPLIPDNQPGPFTPPDSD